MTKKNCLVFSGFTLLPLSKGCLVIDIMGFTMCSRLEFPCLVEIVHKKKELKIKRNLGLMLNICIVSSVICFLCLNVHTFAIRFQMVDRLDEGLMSPDLGPLDYKALYKAINHDGLFLYFLSFSFPNYNYM